MRKSLSYILGISLSLAQAGCIVLADRRDPHFFNAIEPSYSYTRDNKESPIQTTQYSPPISDKSVSKRKENTLYR